MLALCAVQARSKEVRDLRASPACSTARGRAGGDRPGMSLRLRQLSDARPQTPPGRAWYGACVKVRGRIVRASGRHDAST